MKKITRVLCLILAFSLFTFLALGSGSTDEGKEIVPNTEANNSAKESEASNISTEENNSTEGSNKVTIEEQVLLDQDSIKITAKEYVDDSIWGEGIKVLIENSGEKNVTVSCNALIVNNYMIYDFFVAEVAAGKKANETIYLSSNQLEAAGIDCIGQVEIYFHVYDDETYDTIFDSDVVTIQTSAFADMDITPADTGFELYNQDGVRIVGKFVDENSFWGTAVLLYLENNSGQNISVSCDNMSINGFMVTPLFSSTIYDGKMAVSEITIFESDLTDNGIEAVEEVELSFQIYNDETWETIVDTDPISFAVAAE